MKDKQFEQLFKNALGKYEAPYNASDWAAMEKMLDAKPNNYLLLKAGEIVLVCAAVWFIANPFIQSRLDQNEQVNNTILIDESNQTNDLVETTEIITTQELTPNDFENSSATAIIDEAEIEAAQAISSEVVSEENVLSSISTASNAIHTDAFKNSNPVASQQITVWSGSTLNAKAIQLESDLAAFRAHIASDDIYALNVAFNMNGETYSENKKAWIIADINERSAKSLSRIRNLEGIDHSLNNASEAISLSEQADLQTKPFAFLSDVSQNMIYGIEYSPDIPSNNFSSNFQTGNTLGFNMKYEVNSKVRLVTGVHYYSFKMENPGFCMDAVNGFTGEILINDETALSGQSIGGQNSISSSDCFSHSRHYKRQIEIPFEADVQLNQFGNFSMFLNSGVSMYLINREYFDYYLEDGAIQLRDDGDFTEILNGLDGPEESQFRLFEKDETGHVKIGLGLEYKLQNAVGIRVQPQLKIPVSFQDGFSTNLMRYSVATGLYYHF